MTRSRQVSLAVPVAVPLPTANSSRAAATPIEALMRALSRFVRTSRRNMGAGSSLLDTGLLGIGMHGLTQQRADDRVGHGGPPSLPSGRSDVAAAGMAADAAAVGAAQPTKSGASGTSGVHYALGVRSARDIRCVPDVHGPGVHPSGVHDAGAVGGDAVGAAQEAGGPTRPVRERPPALLAGVLIRRTRCA